eukprot:scaffold2871_cov106-Isochrysis_galbana.AAC.8
MPAPAPSDHLAPFQIGTTHKSSSRSRHSGNGAEAAPSTCRTSNAAMLAPALCWASCPRRRPMAAQQPPAVPGRPTIDRASALNPMLRPMSSGPAPAVPAAARAAIVRSRVPLKRALNPMLRPMSSGPAPAVPAAVRAAIARSRVPLKCGVEKRAREKGGSLYLVNGAAIFVHLWALCFRPYGGGRRRERLPPQLGGASRRPPGEPL